MERERLTELGALAQNEEIEEYKYETSLNTHVREEKKLYSSQQLESRKRNCCSAFQKNESKQDQESDDDFQPMPIRQKRKLSLPKKGPSESEVVDNGSYKHQCGEKPPSDSFVSPIAESPIHDKASSSDMGTEQDDENEDMPVPLSELDFKEFNDVYQKMDNAKKWVLTTNKIVEDELYKFGKKCHYEHLCHSFIVDPNDKTFIKEGIFTEHEIEEIRKYKPKPLPTMPLDLLRYLNSFDVTSTSELRDLIFKTEQWNNAYDTQKHFDYDWIRNTIYNLVREYETDALADKTNTETWFMVHVWSLIDRCFESIKGMRVLRGESSSLASSIRKNRNRTGASVKQMEKKIMGRRGDILIRRLNTEYGCGEAGKLYDGPNGTKLLQERGRKTPKMMKDQFDILCTLVESKESKIRSLETIGFIHAGLFMLLLRLDSPAGYICRISRSKMLSVPSTIGEFGKKVLPIIVLAWKAKKIVSNTIWMMDKNDDDDPLETLQRSCDDTLSPPRHEIRLPTCFDTPNKNKNGMNNKNKKGIPSNKDKTTPKRTSKNGM